jgi:hypothetical protein
MQNFGFIVPFLEQSLRGDEGVKGSESPPYTKSPLALKPQGA